MAGGLLNLVSIGQQNIVLNGNPDKTFWKAGYKKYSNFGMQKFRLDYEGSRTLNLTEDSTFTFNVPRYGDLLVDSFINIFLPNIWSPILPPQLISTTPEYQYTDWSPYNFRWIDYIGAQMIRKITINCGNQKLQEYSGAYLLSVVQRDFSTEKRELFNEMIGHTSELIDPGNADGRINQYPNAYYTNNPAGPEPSLRGRNLIIPMNCLFGLKSQMAFPLVALQYNELSFQITFRPINELFQIRDVYEYLNDFPYIQPNFNVDYQQMYRFLQPPPDVELNQASYQDTRSIWNSNIYLTCTYAFLANEEREAFAANPHTYIFKQVREKIFYDITGQNRVKLDSTSLVSSWMFYFQRSDVNVRNEWSNYTNWPYANIMPLNAIVAPNSGTYSVIDPSGVEEMIGPGINPDRFFTGIFITQNYSPINDKIILQSLGILFNGEYRENQQTYNVYQYLEKYTRTGGGYYTDGLLCYNFCLDTSPFHLQPSGAQSTSPFNRIEFEFSTIYPPPNLNAQTLTICDPDTGQIVGINKNTWDIYLYNYNLVVFEEVINFVEFYSGNAGLKYAL